MSRQWKSFSHQIRRVLELRQEVFSRLDSRWGEQSGGSQVLGQLVSDVMYRDVL